MTTSFYPPHSAVIPQPHQSTAGVSMHHQPHHASMMLSQASATAHPYHQNTAPTSPPTLHVTSVGCTSVVGDVVVPGGFHHYHQQPHAGEQQRNVAAHQQQDFMLHHPYAEFQPASAAATLNPSAATQQQQRHHYAPRHSPMPTTPATAVYQRHNSHSSAPSSVGPIIAGSKVLSPKQHQHAYEQKPQYGTATAQAAASTTMSGAGGGGAAGFANHANCVILASGQPALVVVDPLTRKLTIPCDRIYETRAHLRQSIPSLCQLFLNGRCRQGVLCHQVHACLATVHALRLRVDRLPVCCVEHGDQNFMDVSANPSSNNATIASCLSMWSPQVVCRTFVVMPVPNPNNNISSDRNPHSLHQQQQPSPAATSTLMAIPLRKMSMTLGLQQVLEYATGSVLDCIMPSLLLRRGGTAPPATMQHNSMLLPGMTFTSAAVTTTTNSCGAGVHHHADPKDDGMALTLDLQVIAPHLNLCRLHLVDRCRFAEDCKFLHVCKEVAGGAAVLNHPQQSKQQLVQHQVEHHPHTHTPYNVVVHDNHIDQHIRPEEDRLLLHRLDDSIDAAATTVIMSMTLTASTPSDMDMAVDDSFDGDCSSNEQLQSLGPVAGMSDSFAAVSPFSLNQISPTVCKRFHNYGVGGSGSSNSSWSYDPYGRITTSAVTTIGAVAK